MKDYSLNSEESKKFILNYEIHENEKQIIVNLASKEKYIVPYTIENEKKVLKKMKQQVLKSNNFIEKKQKNLIESKFVASSFKSLAIIWGLLSVLFIKLSELFIGYSFIILTLASIITVFVEKKKIKEYKNIIKEIDKNKLFLENEELLNEKIMSNSNILLNTKEKTKDIVNANKNDMFYSDKEEKKVFNLNNIDKIKYEELEKIIENIKRDEEFGFDYSSDSKEKVKVKEKVIYGQHEEC